MKVGKNRRHRRIQEALDARQMSFADVARALKLSRSLVTETSKGIKNNKRVLQYFLSLNIDPSHLDLPKSMKTRPGEAVTTKA